MGETSKASRIVYKVTEEMDPTEILCTTYQMRDMYSELGMGHYSSLDTMNYIQHHAAIKDVKAGARVLDMCCGRALLLPLLRYHKAQISHYIGVDIHPANFRPALSNAGSTKIGARRFALNSPGAGEPFYPFAVTFIESNVATMSLALAAAGINSVDHVVYTASIEHMQKEAGLQSLVEAYDLLTPNGTMFLSTPNTEGDPYDTQYAAHLYEWNLEELIQAVETIGFTIESKWGLVCKAGDFQQRVKEYYPEQLDRVTLLREYLPSEWFYSFIALEMPLIADEVALKLRKRM